MEGSVCKSDIQAAQRDAKRQNKMKFFTDLKKKGVIKGWTEAMQLMVEGGRYIFQAVRHYAFWALADDVEDDVKSLPAGRDSICAYSADGSTNLGSSSLAIFASSRDEAWASISAPMGSGAFASDQGQPQYLAPVASSESRSLSSRPVGGPVSDATCSVDTAALNGLPGQVDVQDQLQQMELDQCVQSLQKMLQIAPEAAPSSIWSWRQRLKPRPPGVKAPRAKRTSVSHWLQHRWQAFMGKLRPRRRRRVSPGEDFCKLFWAWFRVLVVVVVVAAGLLRRIDLSRKGQMVPEICVICAEYFTGIEYWPVRTLAQNSHLGVVQVVLQGLGQGFMSTVFPAVVVAVMLMLTWGYEGSSGIAILAASSVSGTGFQGGIASFGAIAANAHKIVHLTTYHSMTRHRANLCAQLGDGTAHAGNTISVVNAFSAVFNVNLTLLAQTFSTRGKVALKHFAPSDSAVGNLNGTRPILAGGEHCPIVLFRVVHEQNWPNTFFQPFFSTRKGRMKCQIFQDALN
ncbi:K(+)-insensitive pyrophosphate-energized proton pump [Symbiodinium microadriaticum]|uniref:H(+)-exporting diphosphatase n=1 Tax=Symbiodinium microadriaticum TaxID=2951 RepID=A0A1Q9CKJ7_SYMMI|nr:K(+)-insensitive pyrophosphate-energized proton pump [Symbiodinium microadriaticum]